MISVLRLVLCVYLVTWEPWNVATELLRAWPTLDARGGWAVAELTAHVVFAIMAVVGGMALWTRLPHGPILAALGLAASTGRALQIARYSWLPHDFTPAMADVLAVIAIAHAWLWIAFLARYQDQLTDGNSPAGRSEHLRL